jgi:hypothetical protein
MSAIHRFEYATAEHPSLKCVHRSDCTVPFAVER